MFWYCPIIQNFGAHFNLFKQSKMNIEISIEEVFWGTEQNLLCNLIFEAKKHIYVCWCRKQIPTFFSYIDKIWYLKEIEKIISEQNNLKEKWQKRWEPLLQA